MKIYQKSEHENHTADPCLFYRASKGKKLFVAIYVDDGIIARTDSQEISEFIKSFKREFKIKVGSLACFLGSKLES